MEKEDTVSSEINKPDREKRTSTVRLRGGNEDTDLDTEQWRLKVERQGDKDTRFDHRIYTSILPSCAEK